MANTLIIDGDYAMGSAMDMNRDLTRPIEEVRSAPDDGLMRRGASRSDPETLASLPELRRGGVAAALVKIAGRIARPNAPLWGFRSGDIAYSHAMGQISYYELMEAKGEARVLYDSADVTDHVDRWEAADDYTDLPVGFIIGMEGADPVLSPDHLGEWWDKGLRVISLSHYGVSTYSHGTGTGTEGGLFAPARPLLERMEALGIVLDISHTSDESIRQSLDVYSGPILSSHQNCRAITDGERQLPDDLLRDLIDRGGVIGISMDTWMIYPGLDWGGYHPPRREVFPREAVTLEHYADNIDHVCQMAGDAMHVGIGGDTDGQGGREGAPFEIDTVADYRKVADVLDRRGYSTENVHSVMYKNWQRFYEEWLPESG